MRCLLTVLWLLHTTVSVADVPRGFYRLRAEGRSESGWSGVTLPSCGKSADSFLSTISKLNIDYSELVRVDGDVWPIDSKTNDRISLANTEVIKPLMVLLGFWRGNDGRTAFGLMAVVGLGDNGEPRCGDGLTLKGDFATQRGQKGKGPARP
jgi:hypothetical protein